MAMTPDDNPAPPPGAELDALVAIALGWTDVERRVEFDGSVADYTGHEPQFGLFTFVPRFSSDASWEGLRLLVGRMEALGWACSTDSDATTDPPIRQVSFVNIRDPHIFRRRDGESIPHAAALAAIAALTAPEGGRDE